MVWTKLSFTQTLKSRSVARQIVQILDGGTDSTMYLKEKVSVVSNITKKSSYPASDYFTNSSSHSIDYVSEIVCHARGRQDVSSGYRRSKSPTWRRPPSRKSDSEKLGYSRE